jgi:hypothetical protein
MPYKDPKDRAAARTRYEEKRKAAGDGHDHGKRGGPANALPRERSRFGARIHLPAEDGCVFVLSDAHYWRGEPSMAHKAALKLARKMKPFAAINNGDALDGSSISRYDPVSFVNLRKRLTVAEELEAVTAHLTPFENMDFIKWRTWNMGNHDARFETILATKVPQFAGVNGFRLKHHFPGWAPAWSTWIGEDVVVKHRMKGGTYAAANNTIYAGRSIVTGHDHQLWVKAFTDYNGTRWGIDAGTLQDVWAEPFLDYTEDNAQNWQSGFVILHFRAGRFTGPELVHALPDGRVLFRGEELKLS